MGRKLREEDERGGGLPAFSLRVVVVKLCVSGYCFCGAADGWGETSLTACSAIHTQATVAIRECEDIMQLVFCHGVIRKYS